MHTTQWLRHYCSKADFVFNLAGVNRPVNPEDFMTGNFGFASQLLECLKKHNIEVGVTISRNTVVPSWTDLMN